MKITIQQGPETMISLSGQLDTLSAVDFEKEIRKAIDSSPGIIVLDGKDLTYISSAGLRLLLTLRKGLAEKGGRLKLQNIREEIMEIFNITGFSSILDIE
ncbi:MAG: STAS domain-containing protein [Tannerellaceae bacterium]|jgi:anti-sigma B factor antagonist/stage II sporulation protein AA (anti-sigma F factor antagonist)|nr:STAS domain-containing protein [Tannerellaceae bacterium]